LTLLTSYFLCGNVFRFPTIYFAPKNSKKSPKSYDVRYVTVWYNYMSVCIEYHICQLVCIRYSTKTHKSQFICEITYYVYELTQNKKLRIGTLRFLGSLKDHSICIDIDLDQLRTQRSYRVWATFSFYL